MLRRTKHSNNEVVAPKEEKEEASLSRGFASILEMC
jgi:hypothetical protein